MSVHAIRSPSGHSRWAACPGSVAMEEGLPDRGSDYADEGTAAHFLAGTCLTQNQDPVYCLGKIILVSDTGECSFTDADSHPSEGSAFKVDVDMAGHVRTYVKAMEAYAVGGTLLVEQSVPIDHLTKEEGATGTSDAIILQPDVLIVADLKYGRGEPVSPARNGQLMMYASGAIKIVEMLGDVPEKIKLVIHQPRISHDPLEWDTTLTELRRFEEEAVLASEASVAASTYFATYGEIHEKYLKPSESACRWCKAKATCPAAAAHVESVLEGQFEKLGTTTVKPEAAVALMVKGDGATLAAKMNAVGMIEDWCKAVRAEVERCVLADPTSVPGYKIVQGKKGNRSWASTEEAEAMMKDMRVKHDQMYNYQVISPTQAEKVFKEGGIGPRQWPKLQALITQTAGKPSVAPESDPRPALAPAADAFEVLPTDGSDLC